MKNRYLFLYLVVFYTTGIFCQTPDAEIKNLTKRFENKEFSIYDYQKKAKTWQLINEKYIYPEIPFDSVTGDYRYQFVYVFDSLDKEIIYNRILEYMAIKQDNLSNVIDYQDYNLGKMVLKVQNIFSDKNGLMIYYKSTYRITIVNNKVRFELFNLGVEYVYDTFDNGVNVFSNYIVEYSLKELFPVTNLHQKFWEEKIQILSSFDKGIRDSCLDLVKFIRNFENDYNF